MIVSTEIQDETGLWKLSANYDHEKRRYYGVGLEQPVDEDYWDNPDFLYGELFNLVKAMAEDNPTIPVGELTYSTYTYLCRRRDEIVGLLEILEYGRNLGWDRIK